jgi:phosphohistidine phosphatase SixA
MISFNNCAADVSRSLAQNGAWQTNCFAAFGIAHAVSPASLLVSNDVLNRSAQRFAQPC